MPAVHFAGAKHGVRRPVLAGAAVDMAGLRAGSTVMLLAMQPSVLPQPTMPAMVSSFMQFCSDTT